MDVVPTDPVRLTFGNSSCDLLVTKATVTFRFLSKEMPFAFYVSESVPVSLLLGMEFIRKSCLTIKVNELYAEIESYMMDRKILMMEGTTDDNRMYPVTVFEDTVIDPKTNQIIILYCRYIETGTVIFEPDILFMRRRDITIPSSLVFFRP